MKITLILVINFLYFYIFKILIFETVVNSNIETVSVNRI